MMANYYLDIETTGLDPNKDKIITIQYMKLDEATSMPIGELNILREWESSEKDILERFMGESGVMDSNGFNFIPVGYNLRFEHSFLMRRAEIHGLLRIDILERPFLDLKACCVIMNGGRFSGSGLDKITGKPQDGSSVPRWYKEKDYDSIDGYVTKEAEEFVKFSSFLHKEMPKTLAMFRENILKN